MYEGMCVVVYMYTLMSNVCIVCIVFGNNPIYGFQTNKKKYSDFSLKISLFLPGNN